MAPPTAASWWRAPTVGREPPHCPAIRTRWRTRRPRSGRRRPYQATWCCTATPIRPEAARTTRTSRWLARPTGWEDDEVLWRERYEALAEGSRRTAQALDEVAARLVPPPVPARPPEKAAKSEHVDYGQAAWRWQEQAREIAAEGVQKLRAVAVQLRDAAEEG